MVGVQELVRTGLAQHIVADRGMLSGMWPQLIHPVRVRQEPNVDDHIRIHRETVLKTEGLDGHADVCNGLAAEGTLDGRAQGGDGKGRGVDHQVRRSPYRRKQRPFRRDALSERLAALQRVAPPVVLVPADQTLVRRLQKQHPGTDSAGGQVGADRLEVAGEASGPDIHHHSELSDA